jgi:hypothetical protein
MQMLFFRPVVEDVKATEILAEAAKDFDGVVEEAAITSPDQETFGGIPRQVEKRLIVTGSRLGVWILMRADQHLVVIIAGNQREPTSTFDGLRGRKADDQVHGISPDNRDEDSCRGEQDYSTNRRRDK